MIPEEAVEAAAKALRDKYAKEVCELPVSSFLDDARTALEAVAALPLAQLVRRRGRTEVESAALWEKLLEGELPVDESIQITSSDVNRQTAERWAGEAM